MDSLTQVALGAAVGEAVLGKEEGNKAALWGAIAGTIPDLDILIYPFVTEVQELAIHRGLSHSILFAVTAAIPAGMGLSRLHKQNTPWPKWALMIALVFLTHALLDAFTNYGTQLLYPFSNYPFSFDSIFIIDLLYTLPLAIGLILALRTKNNLPKRRKFNNIGLMLSTAYLAFTVLNKLMITGVFKDALAYENIEYKQLFTNPSPFNNVMWYAVADDDSDLWVGIYSWFDPNENISFKRVPKNAQLLAPYADQLPVERLMWFSKGYFAVEENESGLVLNDLRFPRSDFYLDDSGAYVFSFRLIPDPADSTQFIDISHLLWVMGDVVLLGVMWKARLIGAGLSTLQICNAESIHKARSSVCWNVRLS